jgi:hypothetical protein
MNELWRRCVRLTRSLYACAQTIVGATVSATVTMHSMTTLLANIANIPIYAHVADKVYAAVDDCEHVHTRRW